MIQDIPSFLYLMIKKPMKSYYYFIKIQYLGFRFSGWQKQQDVKTIQGMVDRTISFILGHDNHRTLGAGRTDAKVSANQYALELFINEKLDEDSFLSDLNKNLPPDIKALEVKEVDEKLNIINDPKIKEYIYIFTDKERPHPFSAPFMVYFDHELNIELMKKGALLFQGIHNFKNYCYKPSENTVLVREVLYCEITENNLYTASFFPEHSWILHVHGKGFMRHQIRSMMGTLVSLGRGDITLEEISGSLLNEDSKEVGFIAPSSGLMLNQIHFQKEIT